MAVVIAAILVLALAGGLVYVLRSKNNTPANSATVTTFHSTTFHSTTPTTTHRATTHGATTPRLRRRHLRANRLRRRALATLLTQSVADRSDINAASNDVTSCGPSLAQDGQVFESAAGSRQQLITQLSTLSGASTLPSTMIQDLTDAWQASAQVDDDYARWANDESSTWLHAE